MALGYPFMSTMNAPRYLRTVAEMNLAIKWGNTTESQYLDFKEAVGSEAGSKNRESQQKEICRDITQFANHLGGCLLIGVSEIETSNKLKVAGAVRHLQNPDSLRSWIEQSLDKYCIPSTFSRDLTIIEHPEGTVMAVNIQPSRAPVVIWDREQHVMQAISRTSHGKTYLNPDELERLRMNGSRAAKISLDDAFSKAANPEVDLVGGVFTYNTNRGRWETAPINGFIGLGSRRDDAFELRIPLSGSSGIPTLTVPYGLLRECWVNASNQISMLLHSHVTWDRKTLSFATTLFENR